MPWPRSGRHWRSGWPQLGASALAAGAPIVLTLIVNVVSSAAVFDAPSAAPRRLPVLLARSIEDDPARWHLQENCAREGYTVCELFDEIPSTAWEVLWSQDGLTWRATAEQSDRIRREVILWRAFVDYPLQQSWSLVPGPWSLVRNAAVQFVSIGANNFYPARIESHDPLRVAILNDARPGALLNGFGAFWAATTLGGVAALAAMARHDRLASGREREIIAVVLVGLVANAAIFGGLSAPVDRYQGRLIWT
ncbi:MAG: hypothetical protein H0W36_03080, partial [Gemmatimonadetes bacterium]|nr:hypothetical protein [Gemmatimonadota bacterium]